VVNKSSTDLVDSLERVIRLHVLEALGDDPTMDLRTMPLAGLLHVYGTWRSRFVPQRPRTVHSSDALLAGNHPAYLGPGLGAVLHDLAVGGDLRRYLPTGIETVYDPRARFGNLARHPPRRRQDRDLLLSSWGIHHLHLSAGPHRTKPHFSGRTDDVLFVAFRGDDAYLIDLVPHQANWAALSILETIVRNWPNAGIIGQPLADVSMTQPNWSDDDALELREAGVGGPVEIDGKVWFPIGQATDGSPLEVMLHVNRVIWRLRELREGDLAGELQSRAVANNVPNDWRPIVHEDECGFYRGGVFVPVALLVSPRFL
jgi:hypothetical protein